MPTGIFRNYRKVLSGSDEDKKIPFLVVGLPSDLPQRYILEKVPQPADQGRLAAGTAYAAGYLLMTMRERKEESRLHLFP